MARVIKVKEELRDSARAIREHASIVEKLVAWECRQEKSVNGVGEEESEKEIGSVLDDRERQQEDAAAVGQQVRGLAGGPGGRAG